MPQANGDVVQNWYRTGKTEGRPRSSEPRRKGRGTYGPWVENRTGVVPKRPPSCVSVPSGYNSVLLGLEVIVEAGPEAEGPWE